MKITIICICSNILNYGARSLSSYLKSCGHQVELIFVLIEKNQFDGALSSHTLDLLTDQVQSSGLVGLSFTTNFLGQAEQITQRLKQDLLHIPIVWGGIHPTMEPERCIKKVDLVCVGEGYEALKELAEQIEQGKPYQDIKNLWVRDGCTIYPNLPRPLIQDLDEIPDPDYDLATQFILKDDRLLPMTPDLLKNNLMRMESKNRYSVFTSVGCNGNCPFCGNNRLHQIYPERKIRKRKLSRVFTELEQNVKKFGFESVCIQDENFLVRSEYEIFAFSTFYKKYIHLPFQVEFSPQAFDSEKLKILIDAGLKSVQIGVQSIDPETLKSYNRHYTQEKIDEIVEFFSSYKDQVKINLHFITHNPWEKEESLIRSIQYVAALPLWINVKLYPMVLFPDTPFYRKAQEEGLIKDYYQDIVYKNWGIERIKEGGYWVYLFYFINYLRRTRESIETINIFVENLLSPSVIKKSSNNFILLEQLGDFLINEYRTRGWE